MADSELKVVLSAVDNLSPTLQKAVESLDGIQKSIDGLNPSVTQAAGNTEGLNGGLISLASGLEIAQIAVEALKAGFELLEAPIEKAIEEALNAEKAQDLLTGSLISTGQYSASTAKSLVEYAEDVQKATGANSEAVVSHIALGVQMGLTTQRSQEMEEAARKLSVLYGGDVNKAFTVLQQSLAGHSRSLALVLPQIKEYGAAQLSQGAAIDVVNQALTAQYNIYQESLPAAITKAKSSFDEMFKSFGLAVTGSPVLKAAINAGAEAFQQLAELINDNKDTITDFINQGIIGIAQAIPVAVTALGYLEDAYTFIAQGVRVAELGTVSLIEATLKGASLIPGAGSAFKAMGVDIASATASLDANRLSIISNMEAANTSHDQRQAGLTNLKSVIQDYADKVTEAGNTASKAHKDAAAAAEGERVSQSNLNAEHANAVKYYDDYAIGTLKQREQLNAEKQDRDKAYTDFKTYYDEKVALAISKEAEQAEKVASYKASLVGATPGSTGTNAKADADLVAQQNKQTKLKAMLNEELITKKQFDAAMLASSQARETDELTLTTSGQQALITLLAGTNQAMEMSREQAFKAADLKTQQAVAQASLEGATEEQQNQLRIQRAQQTTSDLVNIEQDYYTKQAALQDNIGNTWEATFLRIEAAQKKHGAVMGALEAFSASEQGKALSKGLSDLSSLRNSNNKEAFEVGQAAAIAQATISTFQGATSAFAALAGIPVVGPALGTLAAGAAIAAGLANVQNIAATKFAGQADEGMDSVPSNLAGKSFILSAGEAVIQPEANKDLRDFLSKQKGSSAPTAGVAGKPTIIQMTVNGSASQNDMRTAVDNMIKELRRASERGDLIINAKGVYT